MTSHTTVRRKLTNYQVLASLALNCPNKQLATALFNAAKKLYIQQYKA